MPFKRFWVKLLTINRQLSLNKVAPQHSKPESIDLTRIREYWDS
jgi:hypothetical protein